MGRDGSVKVAENNTISGLIIVWMGFKLNSSTPLQMTLKFSEALAELLPAEFEEFVCIHEN